jgi:membrane carboxypeptidase/penicillin-binding protein PbpC
MFNPLSILARLIYTRDYFLLKSRLQSALPLIQLYKNMAQIDLLKKLLISGEDHRFRYHLGFDVIAIIRAIRNRVFYSRKEGASTIEQQLVRVLTNNFTISFKRKLKEILLATTLRYVVPRKVIPIIYLEVAYYGTNMNGLRAVMRELGISLNDFIQEDLAAEVIARIKYPEPKRISAKRINQILTRKQHLLRLYYRHNNRKLFKIYG